MKKVYKAPTTCSIELRATNIIALSLKDDQINSENQNEFEQNTKGQGSWGNVWGSDDDE